MRSLLRIFACWCGAALLSLPLVAQQLPDQMSPPRLVNDFAGLLDEAQRRSLEQKLADFDRETSTQITVVTVDDLDGYAPADYAQRLHDKWGVGRKGKDNGILILVKPSQPDSRGEAYISVGYGLEGVIPDITAGRILDQEMIPEFRRGSVYDGLDKATNVLMQLSRGEFTADQYAGRDEGGGVAVGLVAILVLFFLFALRIPHFYQTRVILSREKLQLKKEISPCPDDGQGKIVRYGIVWSRRKSRTRRICRRT